MNSSYMFTSKISVIPDYQQQSGQKNFDINLNTFLHPISVQNTQTSMFANNPFQRSFASVVSCKTPLLQKPNDNASKRGFFTAKNDGILNSILKKFTIQKRTLLPPKVPYFEPSHVQKEFEDFKTLPTYLQNNNHRTASAKSNSQSMHNASKNRHEKQRHSIEHDIRVDCDIFNVKKVNNNQTNKQQTNAMKLEAKNLPDSGVSSDPPFEIYSFVEFPAIPTTSTTTTTSHDQTNDASITTKATTKNSTQQKIDESDESDYVKFHDDIAKTTPTFIPRRYNLCEKVTNMVKSPKKLLSIPMMSPKRSCLKPTMRRRTVSECSDDFIVFDRSCCEGSNANIDNIESDNETEIEDDDESDVSDEEDDGVDNNESDEEDFDGEDYCDGNNNEHSSDIMNYESQQPDSGVEEKKVHFNLIPKVHVIVAWEYAYRKARLGDEWKQSAVDRERFAQRVANSSVKIDPILDRDHRNRIFEERFRNLETQ